MRLVPFVLAFLLAVGGAAVAEEPAAITLPVAGLTDANQDAAVKALTALVRSVYECPHHPQSASDKPGKCAACGTMDLIERKVALFASVTPKAADGVLVLVPTAGESVKLSALTAALGDGPVKVDPAKVRLAGAVTLHVAEMRCPN